MEKKKWNTLTKAEKRVAIAKDVLKYVGKGKFEARGGVYYRAIELSNEFDSLSGYDSDKPVELQKILQKATSCTVCAKGALLFADILKKNECKMSEFELGDKEEQNFIAERLTKDWTIKQLGLIESAFEENGQYAIEVGYSAKMADRVEQYREDKRVDDDESALISIMKNIIKNKGTFKP